MNEKKYKYDVSVVIPVYNAEKYLEECISSLIHQSHNFSSIQVLLINDGSTDKSLEICKKYEKYSNVEVIDKKNTGVSDTRNVGIKKSSGKYIMLLDSDDFISSNTVSNLYNFFEKHYDEIDLVTYPLYIYNNKKSTIHRRYKAYDKATSIYDLNEYIHLNQNTINVMFKNLYNDNILFNTKMYLSEDQNFNTELLMKKKKIGFVKEARYYYRRIGISVSSLKNNPYYCFEEIISYNESLLEKYKENNEIPKYIQSLVLHTLNWRLNCDELFPYHYNKEEYKNAKQRIIELIKKIDPDVICSAKNIDLYNKFFFFVFSLRKPELLVEDNSLLIKYDDAILCEKSQVNAEVVQIKIKNNELRLYACIMLPIINNEDIEVYCTKRVKGKTKNIKLDLIKSNRLNKQCEEYKTNLYNFYIKTNVSKNTKLGFNVKINGINIPINLTYNKYTCGKFVTNRKIVLYNKDNKILKITNSYLFNSLFVKIRNDLAVLKRNSKAYLYRIVSKIYPTKRSIYLYSDRNDIIDNAYYQFKHDVNIKDGKNRYYITSMNEEKKNKYFSAYEQKFLVDIGSLKHKVLFLKSEKIYTSFVDLQVYCPFNKGIKYYKDLKKYDLVYLQHGLLHANLVGMYSKEFKEIDKFIISSYFEEENLKNNYNYFEEDLIKSTMPRMKSRLDADKCKNKILFAPSWRKYLIGDLVNNKREIIPDILLKSTFYQEINNLLKSEKLYKLLQENDLIFDFKVHPIFTDYVKYFYTNDRITVSVGDIKPEEYKMLITDFSSVQFDYIFLKRPIMYFVPDMEQIKSGMHTYRKLDLKYEDAFGDLYTNSQEFIDEVTSYISNGFKTKKKYLDRMDNFFFKVDDPCEIIYEKTK
mgnify:CR=1 FL=1